jgi:glycosyltransferase involved in cell wall biosynthesis
MSVLIPTYNQDPGLLRRAIESVVSQAGEAGLQDLWVVDNGSEQGNPEEVVRSAGQGRVKFHRNEKNLGIAGNFNRCIELARGQWIHLLHSDDEVCPGFYKEARAIAEREQPEVIAFRSHYMDASGALRDATPDLSGLTDTVQLRRQFLGYAKIQCAGVVVRRRAYERVGGYRTDLRYLLDVEMWSRLFFHCRTHFSPQVLAKFRLHNQSEGARQRNVGGPSAEHYGIADLLRENMNLTPEEVRLYRRFCHRAVNDFGRERAGARDWEGWKQCATISARHLEGIGERVAFIRRNLRNAWRYCFGTRARGDHGGNA